MLKGALSPTQDSAAVETPERPLAFRQQQQASIKQQLVNVYVRFFFFIPILSPVMVTKWKWLMLVCSEKAPNKRGVWF